MDVSIVPVHYVNAFNANVWHLSQQKGSRLAGLARVEMQKSEKAFWDFYDLADEPTERISKYADVSPSETSRGRRMTTFKNYEKAEFFDHIDTLKMIHDPKSPVSEAFQNSFGRKMDKIIIAGALGTAYSGKDGATPVVLPTSQKLVAFDGSTTTGVGLNLKTLRAIKKKFNKNEVEGEVVLACTSDDIDSLFAETQVTSADFNTVKALVSGAIDSFMGIRFVRLELLPVLSANVTYTVTSGLYGAGTGTVTAANGHSNIAFVKQGVLMVKAEDMTSKISERNDKGDVVQLYSKMSLDATRLEEKCVMEVITSY
jgi:Phage capsid protein